MITKLMQGHERFKAEYFQHERELFAELAQGAHKPTAMMISCSDARVVPNLIVNADPGDLFIVRNVANIVPPFGEDQFNRSVGAAIEYAVHHLRVPHLVVCGHTQCGGLGALIAGHEGLREETPTLAAWLHDAIDLRERLAELARDAAPGTLQRLLAYENVLVQLENLLSYPVVARALEENRIELHGWVYDLQGATLEVYDPQQNAFLPAPKS